MADDVIDKASADIHRNPSDSRECQRRPGQPSWKDNLSSNEAALNARPDALIVSPGGVQQGARKLAPALQRMEASVLNKLRTRLAIDEVYCGARTREELTCRVPTPARAKDEIVSTLRRLINMTQSSEELDDTLASLVSIVHCRHHYCGPPSERRVAAWVDTFPRGPEFECSPVVLARKMRKALGPISVDCAGLNRNGKPCGSRIGGHRVQSCRRSIDELVEVDDCPDPAVWELLLSVLEANRYCHSHRSRPSMQNVCRWLTELLRIHRGIRPGRLASGDTTSVFAKPKHVALTLSRRSQGLQDKIDAALKDKDQFRQAFARYPLPWLTGRLVEFWPSGPDTTPLQVVLDGGSRVYYDPFQRPIREMLRSPMDAKERQDGYVYAYEVVGSPGYVKIGYTSRSVDIRHAEWTDDCNRRATLLYPRGDDAVELVPNARRIEALCHAVLQEYRRRIYCSACQRQHIEYFEVAADKAIQAIRGCASWMKVQPNQTDPESGTRQRGKWNRSIVSEEKFWAMVSGFGSLSLKD